MSAAVQSCTFPTIFEVACDIELWLGERLRETCEEMLAEPIPQSILAAVAELCSPSSVSYTDATLDTAAAQPGWIVWLQQFLGLTIRRPKIENSRMMRRAIREQGVSWLVEDGREFDRIGR